MTSKHTTRATDIDPSDPQSVLRATDWTALEHARGPATDAPEMLIALLDTDQGIRTKALGYLFNTLHHQNTLYSATVPTALYVAAILPDPRTTTAVTKTQQDNPVAMRAELLNWIDSVADEVTAEAETARRRHGFSPADYPPATEIRDLRPTLFSAAFTHVHDPDRHITEAAVQACIPLLDDPQLTHRRQTLVPPVRKTLGTSAHWQHRRQAINALNTWGEDSSDLEARQNPSPFHDTDASLSAAPWHVGQETKEGYNEDPPF